MQESINESFQELDYDQRFPEIDIESTEATIKLTDVSFEQAMDRVQQELNDRKESNFYKRMEVMFGAKSRQKVNYLQEFYDKKLEVLRLSLEEEKEHLKNIVEAKTEEDLEKVELSHKLNLQLIKKRQALVKHEDFIPCIYIHSEKKKPIFGQITQEFSRKGMGNFVAKLGYRSPILHYDTIELNFEWPITSLRKKYYQAAIEWTNPIRKHGNLHLRASSAKEPTYKNVDTQLSSFGAAIYKNEDKYEIEYAHRRPFLHLDVESLLKKEFYRPSTKMSLKFSRVFENTIQFEDITMGQYSQFKSELALPVFGNSKFLKLQYNFRKFYDTFKFRDYFSSDNARKFFWKSTLESNFSISSLAEYGKHHYVNDVMDSLQMRGFESYRKPMPSYANLKASLKFNIHNYPLISDARLVTFLYSQLGCAFLKQQPTKPHTLASTGLGVSFYAGPFTQIELLCNLAQWQSKKLREPVNFQVRFGVFD